MVFGLPWMLLGLLGVPTLAGIYWLRSRSQIRPVSSLFLWADQGRPRQGGRIVERLQTPLTFFLELLAIVALTLAAAAPVMHFPEQMRPLVLVLDNSFSMQAGGPKSVSQRALEKLAVEFRGSRYVARVIFAGAEPQLSGLVLRSADQLLDVAREWTCLAPTSALEPALALAGEIGGPSARILLITDHAPETGFTSEKVEWWSLGEPRANLAIVTASREPVSGGTAEDGDRVLLEVANDSPRAVSTQLTLAGKGESAAAAVSQPVELDPGGLRRFIFTLAPGADVFTAELPPDDLLLDNRVKLISPSSRPLRVKLNYPEIDRASERLVADLRRAGDATGQVTWIDSRPELRITYRAPNKQDAPEDGSRWEILRGDDPVSYEGPFVVDRSHPLMQGVSLDAVIWSAAPAILPEGVPIVTAGNRVLLADRELPNGRHCLQMALNPELSTLTQSVDWPIFIANMVRWEREQQAGPRLANVRLGQTVDVVFPSDEVQEPQAQVTSPANTKQAWPLHDRTLQFRADEPGVYRVQAGTAHYEVGCNALAAAESNLQECRSGRWGNWNQSEILGDREVRLDWAFLLVALACLAAEVGLLSGAGRSGT